LKRGRGRLVMVNGLVLARTWEALLAGELENPLEVTEKSETYHGGVWTGTRPDGTAVPGSEHCEDWKTESIFPTGHFGYSDRMMGEWTLAIDIRPADPLAPSLPRSTAFRACDLESAMPRHDAFVLSGPSRLRASGRLSATGVRLAR
jgi:hypothetical protein